jgi:hypothetical protein
MKAFSRVIGASLLIALAAGCAHNAPAGKGALPSGAVTHVVIMYLYDRGDLGARKEVINAAERLRDISSVRTIWAGRMLTSNRPVVDQSYDIAYVVTCDSEDALQKYLNDPVHVETKQRVLDRYVNKYVVYDFVTGK